MPSKPVSRNQFCRPLVPFRVDGHIYMYMTTQLMRCLERQGNTTQQEGKAINTTQLHTRQSFFKEKKSRLRWDSNPCTRTQHAHEVSLLLGRTPLSTVSIQISIHLPSSAYRHSWTMLPTKCSCKECSCVTMSENLFCCQSRKSFEATLQKNSAT